MIRKFFLAVGCLVSLSQGLASDIPGGNIRDAEGLVPRSFEIVMSPAVVFADGGMYLNTELRYQATEDIGAGAAFGAGELGFNFGGYAMWYMLPDMGSQPAVGLLGGLFFNQVASEDYFLFRISPVVSKHLATNWGGLTPYLSAQISPAFSFGTVPNIFSMRMSMGSLVTINSFNGLRLWAEVGLGIVNSFNEIALGVSFPFSSFGE